MQIPPDEPISNPRGIKAGDRVRYSIGTGGSGLIHWTRVLVVSVGEDNVVVGLRCYPDGGGFSEGEEHLEGEVDPLLPDPVEYRADRLWLADDPNAPTHFNHETKRHEIREGRGKAKKIRVL